MSLFTRFQGRTTSILGVLLWSIVTHVGNAADWKPKVAIQSWSLRSLTFDQALDFAAKHDVHELHLSVHLNPKASKETLLGQKRAWEAKDIHVYSFGVAETSLDKEENRKLFECAKLLGIRQIVVEPQDFKIWDNLEELVREYDIRLAVHNHGIRSLYGNPAVVRAVLKHRDPRIGVCLDVGWITAAGFDAARVFSEYEGRVFDIHLKDKRVEKMKEGEDVAVDTLIGEGNANLRGLFQKLAEVQWPGVLALETDSPVFARDPSAFVDGGLRWVQGRKTEMLKSSP